MAQVQKGRRPKKEEAPELEIQQGDGRSIAKDEQLKRIIKHHPQRDEPKVDSVEPEATPKP
jgi:hypothetical protein